MKNTAFFSIIILLSLQNFFSCGFNIKNSQNQERISKVTIDSTYFIVTDTLLKNIKVRIAVSSDSLFFNIDNKKSNFLWRGKRSIPKQRVTGLFFINKKKIAKHHVFLKNNFLLFTIFDESYRDELFIFDLKKSLLLENKLSYFPSLTSNQNPFIIDKETNRILQIGKVSYTVDGEIQNRKVNVYSFNDEINYKGSFEITKKDELTDEDYISIFDKYRNGFIKK